MRPHPFPRLRWAALAWLLVWGGIYANTWGWTNFLLLCDIAVILTCLGLMAGNRLLLSTQAVSSMVVDTLWTVNLLWRLAFGTFLLGGSEYMFDANYPFAVRLLSCFHVFWPVLLVWALRRVGYDRRAFWMQSALAAIVLILSRFIEPAKNMNYALVDPVLNRAWEPAPLHLAIILGVLVVVIYWPTHQVLLRTLPQAKAGP